MLANAKPLKYDKACSLGKKSSAVSGRENIISSSTVSSDRTEYRSFSCESFI